AQQAIGGVFREVLRFHENALGPVDDLALLERAARALEFVAQADKRVEPRDAQVDAGLYAVLLQRPDDEGGDAGIDCGLDKRPCRSPRRISRPAASLRG